MKIRDTEKLSNITNAPISDIHETKVVEKEKYTSLGEPRITGPATETDLKTLPATSNLPPSNLA
jgi:hypothetical protein